MTIVAFILLCLAFAFAVCLALNMNMDRANVLGISLSFFFGACIIYAAHLIW